MRVSVVKNKLNLPKIYGLMLLCVQNYPKLHVHKCNQRFLDENSTVWYLCGKSEPESIKNSLYYECYLILHKWLLI